MKNSTTRVMAATLAIVLGTAGCSGEDDGDASAAGVPGIVSNATHATPGPSGTATPSPGASAKPGTDPGGGRPGDAANLPRKSDIRSWAYQLQGYASDGVAALARAPQKLVVIDLARDARSSWFRADEIARLHAAGKRVLAYFEIGSIEDFRPEYAPLRSSARDLVLNRWEDWPNEYFVRYWDVRWWDRVIRPRVDQAVRAGFDGVYLDTPLAYEELDLGLVPGQSRDSLGRSMVDLIVKISRYGKAARPGFWVFPQNSPELRRYSGYTEAIDGIGMEELFFLATDEACTESWCAENLNNTRALRDAGKLVLAVDYAANASNIRSACGRYSNERFAGYVTDLELDRISAPCG